MTKPRIFKLREPAGGRTWALWSPWGSTTGFFTFQAAVDCWSADFELEWLVAKMRREGVIR